MLTLVEAMNGAYYNVDHIDVIGYSQDDDGEWFVYFGDETVSDCHGTQEEAEAVMLRLIGALKNKSRHGADIDAKVVKFGYWGNVDEAMNDRARFRHVS